MNLQCLCAKMNPEKCQKEAYKSEFLRSEILHLQVFNVKQKRCMCKKANHQCISQYMRVQHMEINKKYLELIKQIINNFRRYIESLA